MNIMNIEDVGYASYGPTATLGQDGQGPTFVPWAAGTPCHAGCYDLPHGWVESHGYNTLYGDPGTSVRAEDDYRIEGPPTADAMTFEVVIRIRAEVCPGGAGFVRVSVPASPAPDLVFDLKQSGEIEGSMPVTAGLLEPFRAGAIVWAIGGRYDGESDVQAVIRFRGLPAGYVVRSCQGYDLATPVRPATWGGVKAAYR